MIILFSFVLQAVSYEFQSKAGNLLGKNTYRTFLVINGVVGPVLLGGAVATFFTGSEFYIDKGNMTNTVMPVISHWANGWHGLDALTNPWNVVLGLAVFFLARILGALYFINNIDDKDLVALPALPKATISNPCKPWPPRYRKATRPKSARSSV